MGTAGRYGCIQNENSETCMTKMMRVFFANENGAPCDFDSLNPTCEAGDACHTWWSETVADLGCCTFYMPSFISSSLSLPSDDEVRAFGGDFELATIAKGLDIGAGMVRVAESCDVAIPDRCPLGAANEFRFKYRMRLSARFLEKLRMEARAIAMRRGQNADLETLERVTARFVDVLSKKSLAQWGQTADEWVETAQESSTKRDMECGGGDVCVEVDATVSTDASPDVADLPNFELPEGAASGLVPDGDAILDLGGEKVEESAASSLTTSCALLVAALAALLW